MRLLHKVNIIILCFALAHALATFLFRHVLDINDDYILTILTIVMIFVVVKACDAPINIGIILPLILCIVGYFIGTEGAKIIERLEIPVAGCSNSIMTFITTEILGWITYLIAYKKTNK